MQTTASFFLKVFSILLLSTIALEVNAQILINQEGTFNVPFHDTGKAAGNDENTNYTITLKPKKAIENIFVDFSSFVSQLDTLD